MTLASVDWFTTFLLAAGVTFDIGKQKTAPLKLMEEEFSRHTPAEQKALCVWRSGKPIRDRSQLYYLRSSRRGQICFRNGKKLTAENSWACFKGDWPRRRHLAPWYNVMQYMTLNPLIPEMSMQRAIYLLQNWTCLIIFYCQNWGGYLMVQKTSVAMAPRLEASISKDSKE
jgi:hypothetical protein